MIRRYLFTIITLSILLPFAIGRCSNTWHKKMGKILCTDINQNEYLSNLFEIRTNLTDSIEDKNITKLSINLADSYLPTIDEWIYLPWDNLLAAISTLKIISCSVNSVKSLYRFPSLDTLDLSGNNISDFTFLTGLKKLRYLHLSHSVFQKDSFLFTCFLQNYQNKLKLIDLSDSNLKEFELNYIEKYDLSGSANLESITFKQSTPVRFLNLRGNKELKSFKNIAKNDILCVSSINLSDLNDCFAFSLLKNIKVSDKILLNNNKIQSLTEDLFALKNLLSINCSGSSSISIEISNSNLESISSSYFSNYFFDSVNLSNNNLDELDGYIFSRSEFNILDLSRSNISTIGPGVFNLTSVILLNLSNNNITSLEGVFDNTGTIKELYLSFNPIQFLTRDTFKKRQNLEILNLANTFVGVLGENTFSELTSLRKLTLSFTGSAINTTSIKNMFLTDLTICNSSSGYVGPEHFKEFYKLSKLSFFNSSLSNFSGLAFKGLNMLKVLNIKELYIMSGKDIDIFKHLPSLQDLDLSNHKIKNIALEFEGLVSLRTLNLSSNIISDLVVSSFASLKKLEILSLAHNELSNIVLGTFSHLEHLTHLYLNHNTLQKLLPGSFSGLDNLILLDISHNGLFRTKPHILFSNTLTNLKFLYLQKNKLGNQYAVDDHTLRRYEFGLIADQTSLKHIDINDNEWMCSTLIDVLVSFTSKNVTYRPTNPVYIQSNINGISCTP